MTPETPLERLARAYLQVAQTILGPEASDEAQVEYGLALLAADLTHLTPDLRQVFGPTDVQPSCADPCAGAVDIPVVDQDGSIILFTLGGKNQK